MAKNLLADLDIDRVDAVDKPAHKSAFLIMKSEDAAELNAAVNKVATAAEAVVSAIAARKSATEVRKAAWDLAVALGKDVETMTTLQPKKPSPEGDDDPTGNLSSDMKGEDLTAADGSEAAVDPEGKTEGNPEPAADKDHKPMPAEMKGEDLTAEDGSEAEVDPEVKKSRFCVSCAAPVMKGKYVTKNKDARIAKAAPCPMCGAPCDDSGRYTPEGAQQPQPPQPAPAAPAPAPAAPAYPVARSEDKPWDEDDEDKDKKPWETEEFAKAVGSIVAAQLTKFAEGLAPQGGAPIAKSRQAADDTRRPNGKVSYADIVFGQ